MYDLEEQETIDALKAWWRQNAKWVWAGLAIAIVAYGGVQGWRYYQRTQAEKAGTLFEAVRNEARQSDPAKTLQAAKALQEAMPGNPMATRAALIAAAVSHARNDAAGARAELEWVVGHSQEPAMVDLARIREAGLLADEKKYDEALGLLAANHDSTFAALTADRRGDILVAQQKWTEARMAYQFAIEKSPPDGMLKQVAQSKLDAMGGLK
jgi:predicted negative regulator of RcsB-dependent stress response